MQAHDLITHDGQTHTVAAWCRINGIALSTVRYREKKGLAGWDTVKPPMPRGQRPKQNPTYGRFGRQPLNRRGHIKEVRQ